MWWWVFRTQVPLGLARGRSSVASGYRFAYVTTSFPVTWMLDEAIQGRGGLITLVTQTCSFLVSSMTVSRCWPERRSNATSFTEQNCDSLQQPALHAELRNSCYLLNLGGIQIPLSLWFPSEEVTPYLSLLQAGWDSPVTVPRPLTAMEQIHDMHWTQLIHLRRLMWGQKNVGGAVISAVTVMSGSSHLSC